MTETPLHLIGEAVRNLLLLVPMWGARALFIALPALVLLWVLRLPNRETTDTDREGRRSANLKWGAAAALLLQMVIYAVL
jgi:hypothetical protein